MKNPNDYVEQALRSGRAIFHTMGPHAGEEPSVFLERKQKDIDEVGFTIWYARSLKPPKAREFCSQGEPTFVLFYERTRRVTRGSTGGARHAGEDTKTNSPRFGYMTEMCRGDRDIDEFEPVHPAMLQPGRLITGRVDRGACGLVFDYLAPVMPAYSYNRREWVSVYPKSSQCGDWCATKRTSDERSDWYIVAVARLRAPFAVWLRGHFGRPPAQE